MKLHHVAWVGVPLLLGAVAYVESSVGFGRLWATWTHVRPVLELPPPLDLGERELGETVVARFTVANRGGGELLIDQVRVNCACSGLEREVEGQFVRVESLRLGPNEQTDLVLRLSVRGQAGSAVRNGVLFRTNDPDYPEAAVTAVVSRITGGVTAKPASVAFGAVPVGGEARRVFEVRDTAAKTRAIKRVVSASPERFSARLLPQESPSESTAEEGSGALLGRVEVTLLTQQIGPADGEVLVYLDDAVRQPDAVLVTGRVVAVVAASPSSLVLPRSSGAGPVYFGECLCRSNTGKPLSLTLDSAPPGVSAVISVVRDNPSIRIVRIEWKPDPDGHVPEAPQPVRFRACAGDQEMVLEILVHVRRSAAP